MNTEFSIKVISRLIVVIITTLWIFFSVSCKEEPKITVDTDTTLTSIAGRKVVNKISFLISVAVYESSTKSYDLISADLKINYDTCKLTQHLEESVNIITLKESLSDYNIEVSKEGYITYTAKMQKDEIAKWLVEPLVIVLILNNK